jgi:hypothetical protein
MNYTPTERDTADDKAKFVQQFKKFVDSDFEIKKFPKWFYIRLSMCFGHIAHFNQGRFYDTFFTSTRGKVRFLEKCSQWPCCGSPHFTYCDCERELQDWIIDQKLVEKYLKALVEVIESGERRELARLQAKYGGAA